MIIDIVILGLLESEPCHGYEIKKRVEGIMRSAAAVNNNLLYPALRRLMEEGNVEPAPRQRDGATRKICRITTNGLSRLDALLKEFGEAEAERESEFLARVAFFDRLDPENRLRIIALRERALEQKLAHAETLDSDYGSTFDSPWVVAILEDRKRKLAAELEWTKALRTVRAQRAAGRKMGKR
jgi:DNA-binding PadR family transcriptional regulator